MICAMMREPQERWRDEDAGRLYAGERWSTVRRRQRDPRLVARILEKLGPEAPRAGARVLDLPCGTGRIIPGLAARGYQVVGADASMSMLGAVDAAHVPLLVADAARLPFADASFDLVVCCRLLHHLRDEALLHAVTAELVRVSRGFVAASFWDSACLPELTRRVRTRARSKSRRPRGRIARRRAQLARAFESAGASVLAHTASLRFVSRQTFLVARSRTDA